MSVIHNVKSKKRKSGARSKDTVFIGGIFAVSVFLLCIFFFRNDVIVVEPANAPMNEPVSAFVNEPTNAQAATPLLAPPAESAPEPEQPVPNKGKLVFVIDDAGNNLSELEPFLNFPGPLTIAVLPRLPNSVEAARLIREAGKEVFLHQPMESLAGHNPGPGAVFIGMDEDEIRYIINSNLDEIWPVSGLNNHEGSKVSMDNRIMEIVLDICRERGIIFLDSRTTSETVAPLAARRLGMRIMERDVFLDNEKDRDSIIHYINTGLLKAQSNGSVIMIGHAYTGELALVLSEFFRTWQNDGYTLSTVSDLMK